MGEGNCNASSGTVSDKRAREVDFSEFGATTYEEWKASAVAALKDASFEKSMFTKTYEGITLEPLYTRDHTPAPDAAKTLPGESPMLRGGTAGYIARPWEIAQDATSGTPEETSRVLRNELERGATTITFRTHGSGVKSASDAGKLLSGIDLARYPFHVYTGASGKAVGFLIEAARAGHSTSGLSGCIGSDPIGAYLVSGKLPKDFPSLMDELANTIRTAQKESPRLRTVLLRGSVYHEGGANASQEVAYVMAEAIELIGAMQDRGLDIDDFARSVRFEFEMGSNFFMEIAKIRAARAVWARIAEEYSGDAESARANIFGRTSYFTKTVFDPYVNMLRNSTEAFSAVMGGVDGLMVGCFDEAVRTADDFSRRVARNAQIMLQEEFHLLRPIDPAGGSWYIESLTDSLAEQIWATMQDVQKNGGMLACVKSGAVQKAVGDVLQERFKKLATRSDRAVGTNMYANTAEAPLKGAGQTGGKKCCAGEGGDITPIKPRRWTEQFDEMRERTEAYKERTGENVKIFLANMGPLSQHKARADFITGFMEVANFEILKNDGYPTADACAEAAAASKADIAVICSTDATYPELVPPLAKKIKELAPPMKVFLAGAPAEEFKQSYTDAGVDEFISIRSNCLAVLSGIQKGKGMM
ncbi:MAG: acyl-CoA mutase large subunit family protein [Synergistaceae bacterium]|jgi:methylmalonyl-CoA mutase|nr:acyl-CoA mutase large subunit family protein [Synergistaceae bacterium]